MMRLRQITANLSRNLLVLALLMQSVTGTAMLINMASAQANSGIESSIVICTPDGIKTISLAEIEGDTPQEPHLCMCVDGVLNGNITFIAYAGPASPALYPDLKQRVYALLQNENSIPTSILGQTRANPRAPPIPLYS